MNPTITVTAAGVQAMARDLSALSGKDYAAVLRNFAAESAKGAALDAKVASAKQIEAQVRERSNTTKGQVGEAGAYADYALTINLRKSKGRVWYLNKITGKAYMVFDAGPTRGHHLPDVMWGDYLQAAKQRSELINARIREILRRRGIERQSWLQVGDALGVPLATVAPQGALQESVARAANVHGRTFPNGTSTEATHGAQHLITIRNASPVAIKRRGQDRLNRAITRRFTLFQTAVKRGFISDLKFRSSRWPGIFVQAA